MVYTVLIIAVEKELDVNHLVQHGVHQVVVGHAIVTENAATDVDDSSFGKCDSGAAGLGCRPLYDKRA